MRDYEIQKLIYTARDLLSFTEVPKLKSDCYCRYEQDSPDTVEGFQEKLRVVRKLCLKAMKEVQR